MGREVDAQDVYEVTPLVEAVRQELRSSEKNVGGFPKIK